MANYPRHTISIALCTYNGAAYLRDQIDSFINQSRAPDELIVCDDGSSDNTIAILKSYAERTPFPIYIHHNALNLGPSKNFEKSIGLANGDLILLSDQDDVWYTDKIQCLAEAFEEHPELGGIFTDADVVDEDLNPLGYRMWDRVRFTQREQRTVLRGSAHEVLLKHYVVTGATLAFRSQFKALILPVPDSWFHDAWIALLLACVSRLSILQKPAMQYRQHTANVIGGRKKSLWNELRAARGTKRLSYYGREIERFDQLHVLLQTRARHTVDNRALGKVEAKLRHLQRRALLPGNRLARLPLVLFELATLGYHRFARNWQSVMLDMVFQ